MVNKTFGRLRVISESPIKRYKRFFWLCLCQCGNEKIMDGNALRTGRAKSCGCIVAEGIKQRSVIHGRTRTPEYRVWQHIKGRCNTPTDAAYHNYGGRGIKVCNRWNNSFQDFLEDMGLRPSLKHSIERVNNSKGYSPENCKWATRKEQANNTRNTRRIEYNNQSMSVAQWAEKLNVNPFTLYRRLYSGWTDLEIILTPIGQKRRISDG